MPADAGAGMRIAILNLAFDRDLAAGPDLLSRFRTLASASRALASAGAEITVLQRFHRDEELEDLVPAGDRDARTGPGHSVRWRLRVDDPKKPFAGPRARPVALFRLAVDLAPDAVLVNGLMFPAAVAELRLRLDRRCAIALQHHAGGPAQGWLGLQQRALLRQADGFFFTAAGIAAPWIAAGAIRRGQPILEVPESSSDFGPLDRVDARARTGTEGSPALLWVGRLHPRKDPLTAFRAAALALRRLPGLRLFAAFGEAPMQEEITRFLAAEPELGRRTSLLGRVGHAALPAWYSAADLFLTSSPDEGSNYALVEALACGLPAVASGIPAHRALAGETAEYFPPGNPVAGAEAILRAAGRLGEGDAAARARVRSRFEAEVSWSAVSRRTLSALADLAGIRNGSR